MTHRFEVWAPTPDTVRLHLDGELHSMQKREGGWWFVDADASLGSRYGFVLDDDDAVIPDPRSPRQPEGVHELSQLHRVDPSVWTDSAWTGRQLPGGVVYELHIGTFTPEGTFDAAVDKLDHLVDLGVTFVEIMPVNGFNGTHNWGYDGVLWYTVHEAYGGPDGLQRLVDACHARGLGVVLDVVYNHLGPSGNYLERFGPYMSQGANTWGQTINYAGAESGNVRRYAIENALRWFSEFHVDGLRLDAVHAIADTTAVHLLEELAIETRRLSAHLGRPLTLIAESDLNDPTLITPRSGGGYGLDAQWDDDLHHAIHAAVSGERQGYYGDFGSLKGLANTLRQGFFHAGTYSSFRGRRHGRPVDTRRIPASSFVTYTTTHDQVGNRATGDRPGFYLTPGQLAVKAALVLASPYTPMLFMGEEWGASTPFQFFTSHPEPELGKATAEGRKAEFAEHGWDSDDIPDPQDPQTFLRSKLDWSELGDGDHARLLETYRGLLSLRKQYADLTDPWLQNLTVDYDEDEQWIVLHRGSLRVVCNLSPDTVTVPVGGTPLLSWEPPISDETGAATRVPGHSFTILAA
ncbi:malto-oligosyltrehalose trehalohydrolase [Rhodococcus sp. BP-252]|uniref:malto-oligosyltrehalose trehalohydrolase n=1 Tax=unclassified Rhodococcus (in: high G+C Gram-positive bacteria) TaxID=192944 RepID=UPI001C9A9D35|nr:MULTISPECIES: malto-oligosyltrehalose trehalohydrolase [unclassified Rhodococcus (in: high G+C Gram-positive bacteria)]MBY6411326.1 malto-oligosyltrehalose trehalohydrolase [Rhodococcus sp. BP-320]MBY6415985.1 malto-oligosyltrehalose trehalohydrolase [Rhodococcus sp. BP-321]MBY6420506.1 malto-oligosyltrehalose trehalohydrolase [Rhodococcus sp. BP-324]MBY6426192.1 malto-oligosyltrehalose trehalohydrolase [Rhodococcus sp. BP-323]MBY6431267.1 malto-oligosyltrehalose trehalohydrolase [Rhodococc